MNDQFEAKAISNELDTLALRIESLPPHTDYTEAGELVRRAKEAIMRGVGDLHQRETRERFAAQDRLRQVR